MIDRIANQITSFRTRQACLEMPAHRTVREENASLIFTAAALFDQLGDLLPQFKGTPAGDEFVAAYLASTRIIDRGHGPGPQEPEPPVEP